MYLYSFSKHTLIELLSIEFIKSEKGGFRYEITEIGGKPYEEVRPENWAEILYELNQEERLLEMLLK